MKTVAILFLALFTASVPKFYQVGPDLWRSGHPDAGGYDQYEAKGIKTVLSLEDYSEADAAAEKALAEKHHIRFERLPMSGYDKPSVETIHEALARIEALPKPVLVHCMFGRDRTGIVVGAYRISHDGWDADRAIKEMRDLGHLSSLYWWDDVLYEVH